MIFYYEEEDDHTTLVCLNGVVHMGLVVSYDDSLKRMFNNFCDPLATKNRSNKSHLYKFYSAMISGCVESATFIDYRDSHEPTRLENGLYYRSF